MIAYLDTHVAIWLVSGSHDLLTEQARRVINTADLLISPMVCLEAEYLFEIGRLRIGSTELVSKLRAEMGLAVCDKPFPEIELVARVEKWTRDPFDRIIVAQAKTNGLAPLVTADETIRANYVNSIW